MQRRTSFQDRTLALALVASVFSLCLSTGCSLRKQSGLVTPGVLVSPYDTSGGDVLWAVVPPANETGTAVVDPLRVGDQIVAAVSEIRGMQAIPMNRTILAMRSAEITRVSNPAEARDLARMLGADGVVVPSVTAYDPYDPPVMGLTLALFDRPGFLEPKADLLDNPRLFAIQATDATLTELTGFEGQPAAVASRHLDARNHEVLLRIGRYADGRTQPGRALGTRVHLQDMQLYEKFTAHTVVGDLLDQEWLRAARFARSVASARE
ncbi:MAG: hypothetical protein AAF235_01960 [Planctomycetota bacterium]